MTGTAPGAAIGRSTDPRAVAVVAGDVTWRRDELDAAVARAARRLAKAGLASGARVGLLGDDGAPAVAAIHAIWRLGAVLVPLNRRAVAAELGPMLRAAGVTALLTDTAWRDLGRLTLHETGRGELELDLDALVGGGEPEPAGPAAPPEPESDAAAAIVFTSGTAGRPKGAILTHANLAASADAWAAHLEPRAGDRWLACLPFFHVAGLAMVVRASRWGLPLEIHRGFEPGAVAAAIDAGASHVSLVPPLLERLLVARGSAAVPPTLRAILLGGGPAPVDLIGRALAAGYPIQPTYGLTETGSGVAALTPEEARRRPDAAGRALAGVELGIDGGGPSGPSGPGEPGEILVRGPMVFAGYLDDPAATARALAAGWLRTGDLGWLDADGFLVLADRRDDLLISGGENVYPAEVEAVLTAHPAIAEAAVVARSDPTWGAVPVAAIVLRPAADVADAALAEFCRARLAGYKVPVAFHRLTELPRSPGGKLLRRELRAAVAEAGA